MPSIRRLRWWWLELTGVLATTAAAIQPGPIGGSIWAPAGGAPVWRGDSGVAHGEVTGAIQAVVQHPLEPGTLIIGAVNGGIWKTTNAWAATPEWRPKSDHSPSLSISSLTVDTTDPTGDTYIASLSSESSLARAGSSTSGLLRSIDGGEHWTYLDGAGTLLDKNIISAVARGPNIFAAVRWSPSGATGWGIYASTNYGETFQRLVSPGLSPTALPYGRVQMLIGSPDDTQLLYALFTDGTPGHQGIYRSSDLGKTWSHTTSAEIDDLLPNAGDAARIAVSGSSAIYIAVSDYRHGGQVRGYRTSDGGASWIDMGLLDVGASFAVLAITPDPTNPALVYVAGGGIARGESSGRNGYAWSRMDGCPSGSSLNSGSIDCSAPHSDGRQLLVDRTGNLILVCDGGIYARSEPQSSLGFWRSLIGNLQVGEYHNIAWDSKFEVAVAGTQDCGTQRQLGALEGRWIQILGSDGGFVQVDSESLPDLSFVYACTQNFGLSRFTFNSPVGIVSQVFPALRPIDAAVPVQGRFTTPFALNSQTRTRLVIAAANGIYESRDRGDTVAMILPGVTADSLLYGGIIEGASDPELLVFPGSDQRLHFRTGRSSNFENSRQPSPRNLIGLTGRPSDCRTLVVIDTANVWISFDFGGSWLPITGNLDDVGALRVVRIAEASVGFAILLGTDRGVYLTLGEALGVWSKLGVNLPNAPVFDLDFSSADDVLVAATLGRGAWIVRDALHFAFGRLGPVVGAPLMKQSIPNGSTLRLELGAGGTPPLRFQWYRDGVAVVAATNQSLVIPRAQPSHTGDYFVTVQNAFGEVASNPAHIRVYSDASPDCALSPPDDLVGWWPGEQTGRDRITGVNAVAPLGSHFAGGRVGSAFSFNGVDEYLDIASDSSNQGRGPITLLAWIARDAQGAQHSILEKYGPTDGGYALRVTAGDNAAFFVLTNSYAGTSVEGRASIRKNLWHLVAGVWDGHTAAVYVNGRLDQRIAVSGALIPGNTPLRMGARGDDGRTPFQGAIDEIMIFDRALADAEIAAIYAAGASGMCPYSPVVFDPKPSLSAGAVVLRAHLRPTIDYALEVNEDLKPDSWTSLTNFTSDFRSIWEYREPLSNKAGSRVFRLRER